AQGFEPRDPAPADRYERPDAAPGAAYDRQGPYDRPDPYGRPEQTPADPYDPQDPAATGQFERPSAGRGDGFGGTHLQRPVRREPETLPPATGPGDGRTPLF
ncbi:hypothetical protein NGM37_35195, partial [Streptomyces sp. TRM76130]|nr:hypothetical protein [Streptomyces sp. TRM76130]